jgi:hypothetical protein
MTKIISLLIAIVMLSYTGCMMIIAMASHAA